MRGFEKISFKQFSKDIKNDEILYKEYILPHRKTRVSAGYDFIAIDDFVIKPGEILKIATGYKVYMEDDEALFIVVRSSMGFKSNVRMCNQVGVIDADYYNNINNEGHMFVALQNHGDKEFAVKKGDSYAQGIFTKYLICDNDNVSNERVGGLGSTNGRND